MMSYIELINRFWQVDEQKSFSGNEAKLYFYLLKVANAWVPAWPREFEQADPKTAVNSGLSLGTMKKCRDKLIAVGLVGFEEGGKGRGDKVRYQIRYQNLTPLLTPKDPKRYQERVQNLPPSLTPNDDKVSGKVSNSDTYTLYKRLKTFYTLTKGGVRKKIVSFLASKKRQRKAPLVRRVPPKPAPKILPKFGDPFTLHSDSELLNVPFSEWYPTYQMDINEMRCRKVWIQLSPAERLKAKEKTPLYVKSTPNKRFRKAPLNYLEEKTFNDEIIDRHAKDPKPQSTGQRELIRTNYTAQKFKRSGKGDAEA